KYIIFKMDTHADMTNCRLLSNKYYSELCNVLNLTPNNVPNPDTFTGNKSTDILILRELNDKSLISTCFSNAYLNEICNDEYFWMNRTLEKFPFLGDAVQISQNYIPLGTTWKEYYMWLSDLATLDYVILYQSAYGGIRMDIALLMDRVRYNKDIDDVVVSNEKIRNFLLRVSQLMGVESLFWNELNTFKTGKTTKRILFTLLNKYIERQPNLYVGANNMRITREMYRAFFPSFNILRSEGMDINNFPITDLYKFIDLNTYPIIYSPDVDNVDDNEKTESDLSIINSIY
ncbi:unnamed protein product, partial [marine sediment metagenome]